MIRSIFFRLRLWLQRDAVEEELEDELRFHFDHQVSQNIQSGMSRQEAVRQAALVFGGLEQFKQECRDQRGACWLEMPMQDVRYGLRRLGKQPGFAASAITILALSIGANTAVFSVVDATLLQPLPCKDPNHLMVLTEQNLGTHVTKTGASYPDYRAWVNQSRTFEGIAAYWNVSGDGLVFGGISSPEHLQYSVVTNSFFSVLGVSPIQGRIFAAVDETPGASKVFLVSYALWARISKGRQSVIGKTFRLDGDSFTLIGVLPPDFSFPQHCDVWLPFSVLTPRQLTDHVSHPFWGLGRLRPEINIKRSQGEMDVISEQLSKAYPAYNAHWRTRVTPFLDEFAGNIRQSLLVLFGAVLFILLIACASVAILLLSRSETRRKEFALRAALGASRGRLIGQSLAESLILVSLSTVLALLFGHWGLRAIIALSAGTIPRLDRFSLNGSMLAFSSVLVLVTTILIGTSSALQLSTNRFQESLRESARSGTSPHRQRVRHFLVVAEIVITFCLLCGAGLMLRSFQQLHKVNPGFQPERLVTMQIALPDADYLTVQQRTQFLDHLLERLGRSPGVEAAGAVSRLPLTGETNWDSISIADHPAADQSHAPLVESRNVSPHYFRAMGIRLLRGEEFQEGNADQRSRAVIINQCLADRFWPGVNPIGKRLATFDERQNWREVIGVVANVKHLGLDADDEAEIYLPYTWWSSMNVVLRSTSNNSAHLVPIVRREVAALDKGVPIYNVADMDLIIDRSIASQRLDLYLLAGFAGLALFLSIIGLYGLLSFGVNSRQRELAVRLALGARSSEIIYLVVREGMRSVLIGLIGGALTSFALTRLMIGLLYRVSATDPFVFAAVLLTLALIAVLACWSSARRAVQIDPISALRKE